MPPRMVRRLYQAQASRNRVKRPRDKRSPNGNDATDGGHEEAQASQIHLRSLDGERPAQRLSMAQMLRAIFLDEVICDKGSMHAPRKGMEPLEPRWTVLDYDGRLNRCVNMPKDRLLISRFS